MQTSADDGPWMTLQALSNCTLITSAGTSGHGRGELIKLPIRDAFKVLNCEPEHFKIVSPTPLLHGCSVKWLSRTGVQGPGTVELIDGSAPERAVTVRYREQLVGLNERDVIEVDPLPAIDAKLEEAWPAILIEGEDSKKAEEVAEWFYTHFGRPTDGKASD